MKALWLAALLGLALPTQAGRNCDEKPLSVQAASKAMQLAVQLRERLQQRNAEVAIIGRIGRDMSEYGLRYSHAGFVWRNHPKGPWLTRHLLNTCGTAQAELYDEGLANFFMDSPLHYEVLILQPKPELQGKLMQALRQPYRMFEPHYNLVAYPFSTRYQNSNQWVLETLAFAQAGESWNAPTRAAAQSWLQSQGYQPSTLSISALARLGGRLTQANVAFDDHPFGRRISRQIDVVTVESIERFLTQHDWLERREIVRIL
ncbi:DUF2145 domain-containing protein [Chitinimonas sp.]|uniref:DUF2145 domain-containing protein n=1 Tax=Chitinimonas sp. TaxID=1934313 RepID=UPI0035AFA913